MTAFVDTSALLPLLDADDGDHPRVRDAFDQLLGERAALVTSNYVLVESTALLQHRIGLVPVRALHDRLVPLLAVVWVDQTLHELAYRALSAGDRRQVSLVDWTSFEVMRQRGIERAFAVDDDFVGQGFATTP